MEGKSANKCFFLSTGILSMILSGLLFAGCIGGLAATINYDNGCAGFYFYPEYYYYDYDCTHNKYGLPYSSVKIFNFTEEGYPQVRLTFSKDYVTIYPCTPEICSGWYYPEYDTSLLSINDTTIASYPNMIDTGKAYGGKIFTDKYSYFLYYNHSKKVGIYVCLMFGIFFTFIVGMFIFVITIGYAQS